MSSANSFGGEVISLRTETQHKVMPAVSLNNLYCGIEYPQHPHLADNNWSTGHQDGQCTDSVSLTGPTTDTLRLIKQYTPYSFMALMVCNGNDLMVSIAAEERLKLVVFDTECHVLAVGDIAPLGGVVSTYFFLDNHDNAICVKPDSNSLICFPTAGISDDGGSDSVQTIDPCWTSENLVTLITESSDNNFLYCSLPVWDTEENLYWVCLSGVYDYDERTLTSPAHVAVVTIDSTGVTELMASMILEQQWLNNSICCDEGGIFVVTSAINEEGNSYLGYLHYFGYNHETRSITSHWDEAPTYENSGFLKPGQVNIGSGTTPSLFTADDGTPLVAIADNAYPKQNVLAYTRSTGNEISKVPVLPKMRGTTEISMIAAKGRIIYGNSFGQLYSEPNTQLVSNEPGLGLIHIIPGEDPDTLGTIPWENNHVSVVGASMLARASGIIFVHLGNWNVPDAETKGAVYCLSAFDSWDGREIWRIPLGQGRQYYNFGGGIYFNRTGKKIFIGTERYLISIQDYTPLVVPENVVSRSPPKMRAPVTLGSGKKKL